MMPRRSVRNGLPDSATIPQVGLTTTLKTSLRTYSRRFLKRRHTSSPAQHGERLLTRTWSLNVTEHKTAEQRSKTDARHNSRPSSNKGRKRAGFLPSANKTPNDLAWETLVSSASVLTRQGDDSQDEGRPDEAHVVKYSPVKLFGKSVYSGQEVSEHQQSAISCALNGAPMGREGNVGANSASESGPPAHVSLEEYDGFEDGSSEFGQGGEGITIPGTSRGQKSNRGRFLVFDRSPPEGFKVLHRPRVDPEMYGPVTKKRTQLTDGFTKDEARPVFLGKRRRLQHLDMNVGTLDLTQTSLASQQRQEETSPEAKMRPQTRTGRGLWRGRQYFGASQFQLEPQDSVESPKLKTTPVKCHQKELDGFDPVTIPRTDSPRPKNTCKMESPTGIPGEIVQDSSPSMHLLPKRSMNRECGKIDSLALRPGPPSWPESDFVISGTTLSVVAPAGDMGYGHIF